MKEYKIGEGLLKKGGLGSKPITPAPPAPKGQGGRASVAKATGLYVVEDPNVTCGICQVKGHDSNLTGNTPFTGLFICIGKLREKVESLTKERDALVAQVNHESNKR